MRNHSAAATNGNGDVEQAANDAEAYFAGMRIQEQGDSFGGDGGRNESYVVSQNAPQTVYQPAQGMTNGDLLL